MSKLIFFFGLFFYSGCRFHSNESGKEVKPFEKIRDIPPPSGYSRVVAKEGSFEVWLRNIHLKESNRVYLYDGSLKKNQAVQFSVLNIHVGKKDLQQCADAIMRLRAEFLFDNIRFTQIEFLDNDGKSYKWEGGSKKVEFERYLENVFSYCGSASLEKQLKPVKDFEMVEAGDVLIKGGFPGHAMIVVDVALNENGHKVFMLAQSYMPAQDIHIVKNPLNNILSPWFEVSNSEQIITPEWKFYRTQLRRWQ